MTKNDLEQTDRLRGLFDKALDILEADLTSEDEETRRKTALMLLQKIAAHPSLLKPGKDTESDKWQAFWKELNA